MIKVNQIRTYQRVDNFYKVTDVNNEIVYISWFNYFIRNRYKHHIDNLIDDTLVTYDNPCFRKLMGLRSE